METKTDIKTPITVEDIYCKYNRRRRRRRKTRRIILKDRNYP